MTTASASEAIASAAPAVLTGLLSTPVLPADDPSALNAMASPVRIAASAGAAEVAPSRASDAVASASADLVTRLGSGPFSLSSVLAVVAIALLLFVSGGVIYLSSVEWRDRRRRSRRS